MSGFSIMNLLMEYLHVIRDDDVFSQPEFERPNHFQKRLTVKAIVLNPLGECGFVTNPITNTFLLPGGGAKTEDLKREIVRECREELSCEIEVLHEIGRICEFRNRDGKKYVTTCFLACYIKRLQGDFRTEEEKKVGLSASWLHVNKAKEILTMQESALRNGRIPFFYNTAFNILRDTIFFKEYLRQKTLR